VDSVNPATDILIIGDSRVGWGVAEKLVTETLQSGPILSSRAFNLGLAGGGASAILRYLRDHVSQHPASHGMLVINYSPAFIYYFSNGVSEENSDSKDNGLKQTIKYLFSSIFTASIQSLPEDLELLTKETHKKYWASRTVFPDGFVNGQLLSSDGKPFDVAQYQLDYYASIILGNSPAHLDEANRNRKSFIDLVEYFNARNWQVVLIRLPIGKRMRALESKLPEAFKPESLAADLKLTFIDYNQDPRTQNFETLDESHLTPHAARAFASILATDLMRQRK
jgi:hypothetical protein